MKIKILGSGQEVGRSAILLQEKKSVVLDHGTKIDPSPPTFPMECKPDYAIVSHAHLDHCGAVPALFQDGKPPVYMTDITLELATMLIRDSIKIAKKEGFTLPFVKNDLKRMIRNTKIVNYQESFTLGNMEFSLHNSGHIPGSSSILGEAKKSVLYTSDIQLQDTHLIQGAALPKKADVLIMESTYSSKTHPSRKKEEERLLEYVEEALSRNGTVLLPAFAIGRSQEIMMILEDYIDRIAIDGMTRTASGIIAEYGAYLKNPKLFRKLLSKATIVQTREEREKIIGNKNIIISSAGMLGGGPAVHYLEKIKHDPDSKVIFTGFLVDGTPGERLLETKIFENEEERFDVHCDIQKLDLSAHSGKEDLLEIVENIDPELVVCVHGDNCKKFAKELSQITEAIAPKNGEEIRI